MNFKKNKKADMPITILVLLVVAVCTMAVLSFFYSKAKTQSDYLGANLIEEINADIEKFYFYMNAGFSEKESAEKINAEVIGTNLVFIRSKINKEKKIISVEYSMEIAG
jgi:flagellar basal body-associated protein FliL